MGYGEIALKKVQFVLYNYYAVKDAVEDFRRDKMAKKGQREIRSAGFVSDPTYKEVENNMAEIKFVNLSNGGFLARPDRWLNVIEDVLAHLSDDDRKLMYFAYFHWQGNAQAAAELGVNIMTFYKRRAKVFLLFVVKAAEAGLIRLE